MKRILVADDSPISRELMREILELEGFEVVEASDGGEALDKLRRDSFDLVLLDIQMPRKDGYSVVRELCSGWGGRPAPKVIAVTAYAMQGDREKALEGGFSEYITKPIDLAYLRAMVLDLIGE